MERGSETSCPFATGDRRTWPASLVRRDGGCCPTSLARRAGWLAAGTSDRSHCFLRGFAPGSGCWAAGAAYGPAGCGRDVARGTAAGGGAGSLAGGTETERAGLGLAGWTLPPSLLPFAGLGRRFGAAGAGDPCVATGACRGAALGTALLAAGVSDLPGALSDWRGVGPALAPGLPSVLKRCHSRRRASNCPRSMVKRRGWRTPACASPSAASDVPAARVRWDPVGALLSAAMAPPSVQR